MRTGNVVANLVTLNEEFRLPHISEFIERKVRGSESGSLDADERSFHEAEYARMILKLKEAAAESRLPDKPTCRDLLNDLLVRVRLQTVSLKTD